MTGGKYYSATSASEIQNVFQSLPTYLISSTRRRDQRILRRRRGLLALLAIVLSLVWHPLP